MVPLHDCRTNSTSVALKNDQIRVVQASILGSILVNLLLILGSALLTTKLPDQEFLHDAAGTQLLGSLLFVSVFTFLMPVSGRFFQCRLMPKQSFDRLIDCL
jgi:calcium/proton exchanger cax